MKDERKHAIDELFHESLHAQKIEPSDAVWRSLSTHIPTGGVNSFTRYLLTAVAIGVISIVLSTVLNTDPNPPGIKDVTDATQNFQAEVKIQEPLEALPLPEEAPRIEENAKPQTLETERVVKQAEQIPSSTSIINNSSGILPPQESPALEQTIYAADRTSHGMLEQREPILEPNRQGYLKPFETREIESPIYGLGIKDDYVNKATMLFGAGFSPAVNMYPDGQNQNDFSLELTAAYERSRFILEGGVGGNYTSESAKYGITFESLDSVGYFINVNSFGTDPSQPDSVWFETSFKGIYDSIEHYRIEDNTNKYAYLQVPLRIGYRIVEKDRFSIDLKLGVLFSVQIYKDVPEIPYEGNDVNIEVIRDYPDRLITNWQYTASLGLNYNINRQLRFSLEPFYRQYIKSVYAAGSDFSARSPYAFGLRGAVYIHF